MARGNAEVIKLFWRPVTVLVLIGCATLLIARGLDVLGEWGAAHERSAYLQQAIAAGGDTERILCLAAISDPKIQAYLVREPCTHILLASMPAPSPKPDQE